MNMSNDMDRFVVNTSTIVQYSIDVHEIHLIVIIFPTCRYVSELKEEFPRDDK